MQKFPKKDYKLFKDLVSLSQNDLHNLLYKFLKRFYKKSNIINTDNYLIGIGNIPIGLVAHMDTVFDAPPKDIYFDEKKWVFWSPDGLGADDRAGIYIIIKVLLAGYLPTVIFTRDEEIGAMGASELVQDFEKPVTELKYLIQLDRRNYLDAVFYDCTNADFAEYVISFGFVEAEGIFSDISIICPAWNIAGVNLSVGYKNEQSYLEILSMVATLRTFEKVLMMLDKADEAKSFDYGEDLYSNFHWYAFNKRCDECKQLFFDYEMIPVELEDGKIKYYCPDCCVNKVTWCKECGKPMLKNNNQKICYRHNKNV